MKKALSVAIILLFSIQILSAQNFNLQFRSQVSYPYSCASLWAYVNSQGEFALIGTHEGVSIVDVTDPDNAVNLFDVEHAGAPSQWREVKTYGHYAYATNEEDNGILIIDLQYLPDSVKQYQFVFDPPGLPVQTTGHTLWIDEHGRMFVFGGNYSQGYACFDLTADPLNPPYIGKYAERYIHDGFVRGDTLWAGEIYDGQIEVVDVSNPASPDVLTSFHTPHNFSHNCWPTSDNKYIFTTDEVNDSYLASYNVADLSNVTELDRVQSNPGSNVIIHNVHLYNEQFATTAYYKDGVVVFDVSHPDNMIEVASYDTDPNESGGGFAGCWGVYPYLPSGNIIASDMSDAGAPGGKLTVLTPTWVSACWLEGIVTDSITGVLLNNVLVQILSTDQSDNSDLSGVYKTGYGIPGTYTVRFTKSGYQMKEIQNVVLSSGIVNNLNVQLAPLGSTVITGQVIDSISGFAIPDAVINLYGPNSSFYSATTDASGNFSVSVTEDEYGLYDIYAGAWGHHETATYDLNVNGGVIPPLIFKVSLGYYDDFILDLGWTIFTSATTGDWTKGEPIGTYDGPDPINPNLDITGDFADHCYMTGNGGGGFADDDVDGGYTLLRTPEMDLTNYLNPLVRFYAWFANTGGMGTPNDTLIISLTDGSTTVPVFKVTDNNYPEGQWNYFEFLVNDYLPSNETMKVIFYAEDFPNGHVTEAAIDYFRVDGALPTSASEGLVNNEIGLTTYPNPFRGSTVLHYKVDNQDNDTRIEVYDVLGKKLQSMPLTTSTGTVTIGKDLEAGIYMVHLVSGEKSLKLLKIVKAE